MSLTLKVIVAALFLRKLLFIAASMPQKGRIYPWDALCACIIGGPPMPWLLFTGKFVLLWYIAVSCMLKFFGNLKLLLNLPNQLNIASCEIPLTLSVLIFDLYRFTFVVASHHLVK